MKMAEKDGEQRRGYQLENLQGNLGYELHGGHGDKHDHQHPYQLHANLPAMGLGVLEGVQLRSADDRGKTVAETDHHRRGQ